MISVVAGKTSIATYNNVVSLLHKLHRDIIAGEIPVLNSNFVGNFFGLQRRLLIRSVDSIAPLISHFTLLGSLVPQILMLYFNKSVIT